MALSLEKHEELRKLTDALNESRDRIWSGTLSGTDLRLEEQRSMALFTRKHAIEQSAGIGVKPAILPTVVPHATLRGEEARKRIAEIRATPGYLGPELRRDGSFFQLSEEERKALSTETLSLMAGADPSTEES